jgi:hypothetical protein
MITEYILENAIWVPLIGAGAPISPGPDTTVLYPSATLYPSNTLYPGEEE